MRSRKDEGCEESPRREARRGRAQTTRTASASARVCARRVGGGGRGEGGGGERERENKNERVSLVRERSCQGNRWICNRRSMCSARMQGNGVYEARGWWRRAKAQNLAIEERHQRAELRDRRSVVLLPRGMRRGRRRVALKAAKIAVGLIAAAHVRAKEHRLLHMRLDLRRKEDGVWVRGSDVGKEKMKSTHTFLKPI